MPKLASASRLTLLACAWLAACAPIVRVHGFAPSPAEIAQIKPGATTRAEVEALVGLPSSTGVMEDTAWYYVLTETTQRTLFAPEVTDRRVVAIAFDGGGRVSSVRQYGLEDGRVIDLQTRVTLTEGAQLSAIEQILQNFGRIDAGQFIGGDPR